MRTLLSIAGLAALLFLIGPTATLIGKEFAITGAADSSGYRTTPQNAFTVGERLVFDVSYGFITAGEAEMTVPQYDTIRGNVCYKVMFEVNSTPVFSWIYKVRDRYETYLDVKGIFPWRFEQHIREGHFSRDFTADFDQIHHIAMTDEGNYPIPPYVHDIISAFYFARTLDYSQATPGERFHLKNFYKNKTYPLDVKFLGRQTIDVSAGTFNCIIIEPLVREGGLFKSEGRILLWLSDDERKIPVKVSAKIVIGSIDAQLRQYSGLAGPLDSKVKK
jgi:Protein of unknown function (DUF3108)